jgi:mannose-6-phosphate isomerase-like protein (cupin superfamily)
MAEVVHTDEVEPRSVDGAEIRVTLDAHNGSERLRQSVIRIAPGRSYSESPPATEQTVLYVETGRGSLIVGGTTHPLEPDTGAFIAANEHFRIEGDGSDDLVLVAVHTPTDEDAERAYAERKAIVRFAEQPELEASAERRFRYLVNEETGCFDVTQFVGIVQPSKAPFHSHPYDEVGYIIDGEGIAHMNGEQKPLRRASCFHLAPGEVHCIENVGPGPMRILGVFHPSGSPASRTYQDNNAATAASNRAKQPSEEENV